MIEAAVIGHYCAQQIAAYPRVLDQCYALRDPCRHDIAPEELEKRIAQMVKDSYAGFNVTLPHKQAVMKLCASLSDTAGL